MAVSCSNLAGLAGACNYMQTDDFFARTECKVSPTVLTRIARAADPIMASMKKLLPKNERGFISNDMMRTMGKRMTAELRRLWSEKREAALSKPLKDRN